MSALGIIGGTGLLSLPGMEQTGSHGVETPWGDTSAPLAHGRLAGHDLVFLPRHGKHHALAPHRINYRANIHALHEAGVRRVLAVNAVGGIQAGLQPGQVVLPDQVIDYTWGRAHTFFENPGDPVVHVDFTQPYSPAMRGILIDRAREAGITLVPAGTYGATQGPRLESAAEIDRMERDGCTVVGMTGMPEAALARELGLEYCALCVVANLAAGRSGEAITMEIIETHLRAGLGRVHALLLAAVPALAAAPGAQPSG